ncbi:MAG: phosphoglycolate phosphatase [Gammaproteobacteria bacterium]|nr:phosphoglycolate phosphatase [Gammaproteobacteria bacterium]
MNIQAAAVLFDLDGTLVDTAADIAQAANAMLQAMGRTPFDEVTVAGWIGDGIPRLIKRALTGERFAEPDEGLFRKAEVLFGDVYEAHVADLSQPYPNVAETLQTLKSDGFRLACVTNKAGRFTEPLLAALGLRGHFDVVISGDALARVKPDPLPVFVACERLGVGVGDAVLVGDSANDMKAAKAAGMRAIGVHYGYNHGVDLTTLGPVATVDDMARLLDLLRYHGGSVTQRALS